MHRQISITKILDLPFNSIILKYDYHVEGEKVKTMECPQSEDIIDILDNHLLMKVDYNNFYLYDLVNQRVKYTLRGKICAGIISNKYIGILNQGILELYNLDGLERKIPFPLTTIYTNQIFVLPDDKIVLYGFKTYIWDLKDNIIVLENHIDHHIEHVCLFKDKLVTGSQDCTIKIWNTNGFCEAILSGHQSHISNLLVSGDLIISTCNRGEIRIWKNNICSLIIQDYNNIRNMLVIGNKIVTCYGYGYDYSNFRKIRIWSLEDGSLLKTIQEDPCIQSIQAFPNNQLICNYNDTFEIWDLDLYECVKRWNFENPVPFIYLFKDMFITNNKNGLVLWR